MRIYQTTLTLPSYKRGFHLITTQIESTLKNYPVEIGIINIFIKHTSASLTINENVDPTVREDMEKFFSESVDNKPYYKHTYEGSDDMPAHIKSSLLGQSLNIPITNNQLNLGTWQGIYLGEHRDRAGQRELVITIYGE